MLWIILSLSSIGIILGIGIALFLESQRDKQDESFWKMVNYFNNKGDK